VVTLTPLDGNRTQVRAATAQLQGGSQSGGVRRFFERGNQRHWTRSPHIFARTRAR
jgi:hypothetical protein